MTANRFSWGQLATVARRLMRDRRGNVLILTAALMIPLIALVGSGVDVARVSLARSRMQVACDAASLAGRWALSAGRNGDVVGTEARKYFNFNFPQGTYGTAAFNPSVEVSGSSSRIVNVSAETSMPMSIMGIFGAKAVTVRTACSARQDFVNTDIVLVLDTTGSMGNRASSSDSRSKIDAMKDAVIALYDQLAPIQTQLEAAGMRLRYAVVPYSANVNIGKEMFKISPDYFRNPMPWFTCTNVNNTNNCETRTLGWDKATIDGADDDWPGCVEEPSTVAFPSSQASIPTNAYDLQIDNRPTSTSPQTMKWGFWVPQNIDYGWVKAGKNAAGHCPTAAVRLKSWSRGELQSYVAGLSASGQTYHDIGMLWGGRLISNAGIFGDSPDTYSGMPVNKFVIFMTDGQLEPSSTTYSAYGLENWDKRITGGDTASLTARHRQRFNLLCSAVKQRASIWVVAFATGLDTSLTNCATNPGQASVSANSTQLIQKFAEIGKNIGALRLSE
ncbi:MAG: TadE/TadG family protein [Sphingomonas fennica]